VSDVVRQAVFCDFMRSDRPVKEDLLPLETTSYRLKGEREAAVRGLPSLAAVCVISLQQSTGSVRGYLHLAMTL
jgi:hypothetical protein